MTSPQKDDDDVVVDHTSQYSFACCPSFNTYTTNTHIADIASRVVSLHINDDDNDDDDDFEFGFAGFNTIHTSECMPVYPVFNRDLLGDLGSPQTSATKVELRNLFFQEDNSNESTSTTYDHELSPETYCLWAPKSPETPSPSRCMKSSSTGSGPAPVVAKTWRLRNLLRRCKSDGKEGLMLMSTSTLPPKKPKDIISKERSPPRSGANNRRKSYLPYKQELLGFFGSPQTLTKFSIPPF